MLKTQTGLDPTLLSKINEYLVAAQDGLAAYMTGTVRILANDGFVCGKCSANRAGLESPTINPKSLLPMRR